MNEYLALPEVFRFDHFGDGLGEGVLPSILSGRLLKNIAGEEFHVGAVAVLNIFQKSIFAHTCKGFEGFLRPPGYQS